LKLAYGHHFTRIPALEFRRDGLSRFSANGEAS
jgi:hypothetical protein